MRNPYEIKETKEIISPCLIYYEDMIRENVGKILETAGSPKRLWPHVKSHKSMDMVKLLMEYGINKFKTATVAEAEMTAQAGAERVILAYPLIGPNMVRLVKLAKAFPQTTFYGVEDDFSQFQLLSEICEREGFCMPVLVDVNMGMNRTGVELGDLEELYRKASQLPGISLEGLHCYDGNHNNRDFSVRNQQVADKDRQVAAVAEHLRADGIPCDLIVAGGTPSFPCHAGETDWYLSPGTAFINDAGYFKNLPDISCIPAAAILTRVISHPARNIFTTDLGYKGIAADPVVQRGYIVGLEDAEPVIHSEEHWAFRLEDESRIPPVGECLYVVPTHICPTSALYPEILVAEGGKVTKVWKVTARNRKITY
ncbi:MAG: D-TA family PLP-dependent enzyme [Lachnospiraceae bacterium]|nr:D-TA family PLP-dependent enzyme [Lachnospiraceae bacterium]